jgi:hypothetical protein
MGGRAEVGDDEGGRRRRGRQEKASRTGLGVDGAIAVVNVPLEFVREVARASAVAEAGHVEGGPVA